MSEQGSVWKQYQENIRKTEVLQHEIMRGAKEGEPLARKELLEPAYRVYVKVVCRLVKENDVGIAEKSLCKQHLYLFVTGKGRHLRIEYILGKSETLYEL